MTTSPRLRSVAPGEKPRARKRVPRTVAGAASTGTELQLLEAMRNRVAKAVDDANCPARDLAALTRRLQEIRRDIAAIKEAAEQEERESSATADEDFDPADL
jgi:ribosomal protein L29